MNECCYILCKNGALYKQVILSLPMSKCFENFSMFDFPTPQISLPDDLLPLIAPEPLQLEQATPSGANLDIILSKLLNNDAPNDIELQQLSQEERLAVAEVQEKIVCSQKRPDQYQKLFYRRAFKFAQKEFFGKRCKNKSRKMSGFYHYYFGTTAQKMNIPLINFYHPDKKTRPGLKVGQKSFNRGYIRLLLRSQPFREVSALYRTRFQQECKAERQAKIWKFGVYLRGIVGKHGKDGPKLAEIVRSSKCKVPWSSQDIAEASRRAKQDLDQYQFQFSENGGDEEQQEADVESSGGESE